MTESLIGLQESEFAPYWLSALVESAEDAIISKTLDGHITSWNKGAERLFGYTADEAIGKPVTMLIPADHLTEEPVILERLRRGERIEPYETVRVRKDGSLVHISLTVSPIRRPDGEIIGASKIARDITQRRRAETALRESRERLRMAMDAADIYSWEMDLTTRRIEWSANVERVIGFPLPADFRSLLPLLHEEDRDATVQLILRAIEEGGTYESAFRLINPANGEVVWVRGQGVLDRGSEDGQPRFVGITQNITSRKRAEEAVRESERQLRTLADAVPQLVWMAQPDGHIFWYNRRWYEYTGTTPEQMEGWGWQSVHDPEMLPLVVERWKASLETGEAFEMEFPLRGADGVFRWFLTRVNPLRDSHNRIVRWFGTNTDVDEQRRTAQQLREANQLKDEFLATVSHELRTPLTAILGWAHLLRLGQIDKEGAASALETIERNARAQSQLIDDLLDVSRIITGKLRLDIRQLAPASFIESAIEALQPTAEAKGVHLETELDARVVSVTGDPARLQQVVWNLLSNAIKFTPRGGRVQVSLKRVDTHVEIVVSDTGDGIRPEFLPFVFERFRQADQRTTRQHGGLGLGLAIVRHLVELHGGTVQAESHGEGTGATFIVKLPLAPVQQKSGFAERARPADRKAAPSHECDERLDGLKVLVVDDEADARELLRAAIGQCGAEVKVARSVQDALEVVQSGWPDLLISDIGMPGEDGYELIRRVRAMPADNGGRIPAIALTAYARAEDRVQALKAGYQMHVPKPVDLAELVIVVTSLVRRAGQGGG